MNGCELYPDKGQLVADPFASIPAGANASDYLKWYNETYYPVGGGALESNILGLWFAKQASKGTPVTFTAGTKRGRWVGGDLQTTRADGTEEWSDQTLFGDAVDFVNTLMGSGAPVVQGQSSLIAYLSYLACGQETVTGGTNAVITLTSSGAATGGTFTISWVVNGATYTTAPIAWNATAAAIATAIQTALPIWPAGTVTGGGGPINTTPVTLTFSGALGAQPVPLPTVTNTGLTGGTTPAITPTATTLGVPYTHVATPSDTGGFWFGIFKSVGKSVVARHQYNDCRIQSLRIEGSSASKVVKITPTVMSLDPGRYQTASVDPTQADDGLRPFIYTEAHGAINIDGTVYSGTSAFAVVFNWGLNEYYGDDVTPYDVINNVATVTLDGITLLIDSAGIQRYNSQIYGTPTPAPNAQPIHTLPLNGSYQITFTRSNPMTGGASESLFIEIFGVKWDPSLAIPGNPAGGPVELSFTGAMRKTVGGAYLGQTGLPPFRITTKNALDPAFSA